MAGGGLWGFLLFAPLLLGVQANAALGAPEADQSVARAAEIYQRALALWTNSTSPEVESLLREALALQRGSLPQSDRRVTETVDHLGRVFHNRGMSAKSARSTAEATRWFTQAEAWFADAATAMRAATAPDMMLLSDYVSDLAAAEREAGVRSAGLDNACEGMRLRLQLQPPDWTRFVRSLRTMSLSRARLGDGSEAMRLERAAIAAARARGRAAQLASAAFKRNCPDVTV